MLVNALDCSSRGLGSSPRRSHCGVFLGKTLYYNIISLHATVQIGIGEFNAGGRGTLGRSSIPSGGLGEGYGEAVSYDSSEL